MSPVKKHSLEIIMLIANVGGLAIIAWCWLVLGVQRVRLRTSQNYHPAHPGHIESIWRGRVV